MYRPDPVRSKPDETVDVGTWTWDLRSGAIHWSQELFRILGYDPRRDRASTDAFFAAIHPDDAARVRNAITRKVADPVHYRVLWRSGDVRHVSMTGAMLFDDAGQLSNIVGVVSDLTRLAKTQTLQALGNLASGISHDLNNMLTVITGNLELHAATLHALPPELRDAFAALRTAQTLTQRLLAFGGKERGERANIDPQVVVASVVQLLTRALGDGISITTRVEALTPPVFANRAQLEQALVNVAINARDALNGRGRIEVGSRANEQSGQTYTELYVADDGPGVEPALRQRVFEPFYTTKRRGNGAGLGLTLVQRTVEQHGGHVSVEVSNSGGALFRLFFPALEAPRSLPVPLHSGR